MTQLLAFPRPPIRAVRCGFSAQILSFAPATPTPAPPGTALMADCGHPQWPGWQILILLLIAAQAALLLAPTKYNVLRPRRTSASRTVKIRTGGTRTKP